MTGLVRAWMLLLALSAGATLIAVLGAPQAPQLAGLAILLAGWFKARIILGDYLGLNRAPDWRRGFDLVTALALAVLAGLFLVG